MKILRNLLGTENFAAPLFTCFRLLVNFYGAGAAVHQTKFDSPAKPAAYRLFSVACLRSAVPRAPPPFPVSWEGAVHARVLVEAGKGAAQLCGIVRESTITRSVVASAHQINIQERTSE